MKNLCILGIVLTTTLTALWAAYLVWHAADLSPIEKTLWALPAIALWAIVTEVLRYIGANSD